MQSIPKVLFKFLDLVFTLHCPMFAKLEVGIKTTKKYKKDFSVNFQMVKKF